MATKKVVAAKDWLTEGNAVERALSVLGYAMLGQIVVVLPIYILVFLFALITGNG